jgi:hypothetical protein
MCVRVVSRQGLETAMQSGMVASVQELYGFALEVLHSQAGMSLPFVTAAHRDPTFDTLYRLDVDSESSLVGNHITREASIAQGLPSTNNIHPGMYTPPFHGPSTTGSELQHACQAEDFWLQPPVHSQNKTSRH